MNEGLIRIKGRYPDIQVQDYGGIQSRHSNTLKMLRDAFALGGVAFNGLEFNFIIATYDTPDECNPLAEKVPHVLTYSVSDKCLPNIIAIPDFIFVGWPEAGITTYESITAAIMEAGQRPPKIDKLFWIGNSDTHPSRGELLRIAFRHPDDMKCLAMNWQQGTEKRDTRLPSDRYVSLPEHCDYSMLLDIRGVGYSGRLKLLLHSNRPVLMVERPFREFYFSGLKPYEHYIPVKHDLSDLHQKVAEIKTTPDLAKKIAANALVFAKTHLTYAKAIEHLRDLLLEKIAVKR